MGVKIPWEAASSGRSVLAEWEIEPERSALLIIDMQRGYVEPALGVGPILHERFPDIATYYYSRLNEVVSQNILKLRDFFRTHDLEVIYTRMGTQLPEGKDLPAWNWRRAQLGRPESSLFPKDSSEYEIMPSLTPSTGELVLDKNSFSPFASTAIDQLLRNMGIENLIVTGVLTTLAVESACREAGDRGYNVIALEDACAAYTAHDHTEALEGATWWVVKTTEQLIETFGPVLK